MDIFGNKVDMDGKSYDERGKELVLNDYFRINGKIDLNTQRENIYINIGINHILFSFQGDFVSHIMSCISDFYVDTSSVPCYRLSQ